MVSDDGEISLTLYGAFQVTPLYLFSLAKIKLYLFSLTGTSVKTTTQRKKKKKKVAMKCDESCDPTMRFVFDDVEVKQNVYEFHWLSSSFEKKKQKNEKKPSSLG